VCLHRSGPRRDCHGLGLERRAQLAQAAVDLRLDRSLWSPERIGCLGDAQPVHVPEHDRGADGGGQAEQGCGQLLLGLTPVGPLLRPGAPIQCHVETAFEHRLELARRLPVVRPAAPVAREVDRDRGQPRPQPQTGDAVGPIALHCPERPNERVLGNLFRVASIAEQAQRDRVQPVPVQVDEVGKARLEVLRQAPRERVVGIHRPFQHGRFSIRCGRRAGRSCARPATTRS